MGNMEAIAAIKKGCSHNLQSRSCNHRCTIGVMHEIYCDPQAALGTTYHHTIMHHGDVLTQFLGPHVFPRQDPA